MSIGARIKQARKALKMTQAKLAEEVGTSQSNVAMWENDRHQPSRSQVQKLAKALQQSVVWIETGDALNAGTIQPAVMTLPVLGEAQAGAWKEVAAIEETEAEQMPVPVEHRITGARQYWIRVVGDSVDRFMPEGSLALCTDVWDWARDSEDLFRRGKDKLVLCQRERHGLFETTIKQLRVSGSSAELWPASHNPKHDGPIPLGDTSDVNGVSVVAVVTHALVQF
ncbi:MAG: helix-turn-helix domain-containing protein [Alphaproteobacteria bacterium]|nr:helix-turn-helix domain-containing protein [Alphaproteobacteria bacterium]